MCILLSITNLNGWVLKYDLYLDTALKQQRLPAWQPILTAKTVLPLFFAIGVIFVVLGGVLLHYSDIVNTFIYRYTVYNFLE